MTQLLKFFLLLLLFLGRFTAGTAAVPAFPRRDIRANLALEPSTADGLDHHPEAPLFSSAEFKASDLVTAEQKKHMLEEALVAAVQVKRGFSLQLEENTPAMERAFFSTFNRLVKNADHVNALTDVSAEFIQLFTYLIAFADQEFQTSSQSRLAKAIENLNPYFLHTLKILNKIKLGNYEFDLRIEWCLLSFRTQDMSTAVKSVLEMNSIYEEGLNKIPDWHMLTTIFGEISGNDPAHEKLKLYAQSFVTTGDPAFSLSKILKVYQKIKKSINRYQIDDANPLFLNAPERIETLYKSFVFEKILLQTSTNIISKHQFGLLLGSIKGGIDRDLIPGATFEKLFYVALNAFVLYPEYKTPDNLKIISDLSRMLNKDEHYSVIINLLNTIKTKAIDINVIMDIFYQPTKNQELYFNNIQALIVSGQFSHAIQYYHENPINHFYPLGIVNYAVSDNLWGVFDYYIFALANQQGILAALQEIMKIYDQITINPFGEKIPILLSFPPMSLEVLYAMRSESSAERTTPEVDEFLKTHKPSIDILMLYREKNQIVDTGLVAMLEKILKNTTARPKNKQQPHIEEKGNSSGYGIWDLMRNFYGKTAAVVAATTLGYLYVKRYGAVHANVRENAIPENVVVHERRVQELDVPVKTTEEKIKNYIEQFKSLIENMHTLSAHWDGAFAEMEALVKTHSNFHQEVYATQVGESLESKIDIAKSKRRITDDELSQSIKIKDSLKIVSLRLDSFSEQFKKCISDANKIIGDVCQLQSESGSTHLTELDISTWRAELKAGHEKFTNKKMVVEGDHAYTGALEKLIRELNLAEVRKEEAQKEVESLERILKEELDREKKDQKAQEAQRDKCRGLLDAFLDKSQNEEFYEDYINYLVQKRSLIIDEMMRNTAGINFNSSKSLGKWLNNIIDPNGGLKRKREQQKLEDQRRRQEERELKKPKKLEEKAEALPQAQSAAGPALRPSASAAGAASGSAASSAMKASAPIPYAKPNLPIDAGDKTLLKKNLSELQSIGILLQTLIPQFNTSIQRQDAYQAVYRRVFALYMIKMFDKFNTLIESDPNDAYFVNNMVHFLNFKIMRHGLAHCTYTHSDNSFDMALLTYGNRLSQLAAIDMDLLQASKYTEFFRKISEQPIDFASIPIGKSLFTSYSKRTEGESDIDAYLAQPEALIKRFESMRELLNTFNLLIQDRSESPENTLCLQQAIQVEISCAEEIYSKLADLPQYAGLSDFSHLYYQIKGLRNELFHDDAVLRGRVTAAYEAVNRLIPRMINILKQNIVAPDIALRTDLSLT